MKKRKLKLKSWVKETLAAIICMLLLIIFTIIYLNRIQEIEKHESEQREVIQVNFVK